MFRNAIKQDEKLIDTNITENVNDKMTASKLNNVTINIYIYKNYTHLADLANSIIEEHKNKDQREIESEVIRVKRAKAKIKVKIKEINQKFKKDTEICSLVTLIKFSEH